MLGVTTKKNCFERDDDKTEMNLIFLSIFVYCYMKDKKMNCMVCHIYMELKENREHEEEWKRKIGAKNVLK